MSNAFPAGPVPTGHTWAPNTVLDCGMLLLTRRGEALLGRIAGGRGWDLPKAVAGPAETPRAAALRALYRATGLSVAEQAAVTVGWFPYRAGRALQLYAMVSDRVDAPSFVGSVGRGTKRDTGLAGFDWVAFEQIEARSAFATAYVLTRSVDLPRLLLQLTGSAARR